MNSKQILEFLTFVTFIEEFPSLNVTYFEASVRLVWGVKLTAICGGMREKLN